MRSMTGYGRAEHTQDGRTVTVEIKTVNHRFLDVAFRMPRALGFAEQDLRAALGDSLSRGHADVFISYVNRRQDARRVAADVPLALAYRNAARELAEALGLQEELPLSRYAELPDVLAVTEQAEDAEAVLALSQETLRAALLQVVSMREKEGAALKMDLQTHQRRLEEITARITARAPGVVRDYQARLQERVAELNGGAADPQRIAQEVALMADRAAIDEELARLESHFRQMDTLMACGEPVGSRLNFLAQELNREINTIGSKAMDAEIAQCVLDAKAEIEKLREQIQNVE